MSEPINTPQAPRDRSSRLGHGRGGGRGSVAAGVRAGIVLVPLFLAIGGLVARASGSTQDNGWYQSLLLPPLQPPGPVFGIVWSLVYTMLGVVGALIWAQPAGAVRTRALLVFGLGMLANFCWSPLFFSLHQIWPSLLLILVMLGLALWATMLFARLSALAARLMLPYIAWLMFATVLNAWIWRLNPGAGATQLGV